MAAKAAAKHCSKASINFTNLMNFIDFIGRFDSRFIFSFYSASVFYIVRPVRLDRSVKAFLH